MVETGLLYMCECFCDLLLMLELGLMCFIRLGWCWVLFALGLQLHSQQEHGEQPLLYWPCSCLQLPMPALKGLLL